MAGVSAGIGALLVVSLHGIGKENVYAWDGVQRKTAFK